MAYQRKADKNDRTIKCTLYVAKRRAASTTWRAAKETFVAKRRDGVGPGVKIEEMRSVRKAAMTDRAVEVEEDQAPKALLRIALHPSCCFFQRSSITAGGFEVACAVQDMSTAILAVT